MTDQELIRWAAEKIYPQVQEIGDKWYIVPDYIQFFDNAGFIPARELFDPLTNANHLDMVIERIIDLGIDEIHILYTSAGWSVMFWKINGNIGNAFNKSKSHAVLLAAHKALDGE